MAGAYVFCKGDDITIIGNLGVGGDLVLENAVTRGILSTKTDIGGQKFYQLAASITPKYSGGPCMPWRRTSKRSAPRPKGRGRTNSSNPGVSIAALPNAGISGNFGSVRPGSSRTSARSRAEELRDGCANGF